MCDGSLNYRRNVCQRCPLDVGAGFLDSPGVPPSANAHELFRGFSFVAPGLLDEHARASEYKNCESISSTFPTYVNLISIRDEYDFKQEIGNGSYSTVYLAIHKATKAEYAVKVMLSRLCRASGSCIRPLARPINWK